MKKFLFLILLIVAAALALFYFHGGPGYVMVSYQHWMVATSLWVAIAIILLAFVLLHYFFRTWRFFTSLPAVMRQRKKITRAKNFQLYLSQAVINRLMGNHKKAEKYFVKAANASDDPAAMYLLAAQSATVLSEIERREKYLETALAQKPEYQDAVLQIRAK